MAKGTAAARAARVYFGGRPWPGWVGLGGSWASLGGSWAALGGSWAGLGGSWAGAERAWAEPGQGPGQGLERSQIPMGYREVTILPTLTDVLPCGQPLPIETDAD
ncbi:hypothetical protein CHLRE_04g217982v5 [Chlamydomonas reinhardtii]|uniref:Uncharacterized protein n=1 Tax=Chlamydomonas reinhardtii TaxID=3055 RepID=A0A2K3DTM9_CHLRE|nr:uncharacterized protein CHLRE_04g217982v5 [Chlamydomonas reinhardtii]PNW83886.1 hypothetical protein CHLRE_04g217982v5 [Chlamydomonas reinhardtii]